MCPALPHRMSSTPSASCPENTFQRKRTHSVCIYIVLYRTCAVQNVFCVKCVLYRMCSPQNVFCIERILHRTCSVQNAKFAAQRRQSQFSSVSVSCPLYVPAKGHIRDNQTRVQLSSVQFRSVRLGSCLLQNVFCIENVFCVVILGSCSLQATCDHRQNVFCTESVRYRMCSVQNMCSLQNVFSIEYLEADCDHTRPCLQVPCVRQRQILDRAGFRVQGDFLQCREHGTGFRVQGLGFRVQGLGLGLNCWVQAFYAYMIICIRAYIHACMYACMYVYI